VGGIGALTIEPITAARFPALRTLMQRYANLPMDFADAILVLLAERLGSQQVLTWIAVILPSTVPAQGVRFIISYLPE